MTRRDDERMRELVDRLVAMSPDAPEYPEEVVMTKPQATRRSPALVFATAAALVLIGAAIPLLLMRGGPDPVVTEPPVTTQPEATTTVPEPTTIPEQTTLPEETTVPEPPAAAAGETVIYLIQDPENSFLGNPALVALVTRATMEDAIDPFVALRTLTNPNLSPPDEYFTAIPSEVRVMDVTDAGGGLIVVDMNQAFLAGAGGLLADITMLNQLVYTATQHDPEARVQFTFNGQPIVVYGTEGLLLTDELDRPRPVAREDFRDDYLNNIIVTSPAVPDDTGRISITGVARVFEATVSYEVLDLQDNLILQGFTTASEGGPGWGDYTIEIDHDFSAVPGVIRIFSESAEDGSPTDVVTLTLGPAGDGVWDLIPPQ